MTGILSMLIGQIYGGSTPVITDPYFEYTTLLLPGNGTDLKNNNEFLDSSSNAFTVTRNPLTGPNAPTQGTFSPFSQTGWGNYFDGSSSLTPSSGAFLNLGTNPYTIEFFVYLTANSAANHLVAANDTNGLVIVVGNTKTSLNKFGVGDVVATGSGLSTNTWHHVAVVRAGTGSNQTSIYIDGSQAVTGTDSNNWTVTANPRVAGNTAGQRISGYISNLRVVTSALYSGSTINVPTAPFSSSQSGTTFLTCQSNRFLDNGTTGATFTVTGSPSVQAFSPFNPTASWSAATNGGSGYFDGNGDYLTGPTNTATAYNLTGDFTIESWCYFNSVATGYAGIVSWADSGGWNGWQFLNNAGIITFQFLTGSAGAGTVTSSITVTTGQWYHIAVVRSGSTITLYLNGLSVGTASYSSSQTSASSFIKVAADRLGTSLTTGYLASIRVVKGTAVYTSNFTPPTAPLTNITNTSLLLNFTNAGIYDATSKNDLETVGNAQISTAQSKWGGSSMAFDGTGDYLLSPDQPIQRIGTGNFTIECWVYRNSSGTYGLVGKGTGTTGWLLSLNSSNQVVFTYGSSTITSTGTVSATTWTHIAVVREGTSTNQTKIYINGTNDGTGTVSTDFNQANSMYVGADRTGGSAANAYMQDVRVTNYARYTINFTAPTAAFPTL